MTAYLVFLARPLLESDRASSLRHFFLHTSSSGIDASALSGNSDLLLTLGSNSMFVWCLVAFAFLIGFILQRRSLELPDSISQIVKSLKKRTFAEWALPLFYTFIFTLVPMSVILRFYNFLTYRESPCCGFGSGSPADHPSGASRDSLDQSKQKKRKDGILPYNGNRSWAKNCIAQIQKNLEDLRRGRKKENELYIHPLRPNSNENIEILRKEGTKGQIFISKWRFFLGCLKCAFSPFASKTEYVWRKCPMKNLQGEDMCCETHRRKTTTFPYQDYYHCYLKSRGLDYLENYIVWDRWEAYEQGKIDKRPEHSKRIIDIMKQRIRAILPDQTEEIVRFETHIRLTSAMWYLTKFVGNVSIAIILLAEAPAVARWVNHAFQYAIGSPLVNWAWSKEWLHVLDGIAAIPFISQNVGIHIFLLLLAAYLNYSLVTILHQIRLKEIACIMDWVHLIHTHPLKTVRDQLHWDDFQEQSDRSLRQRPLK